MKFDLGYKIGNFKINKIYIIMCRFKIKKILVYNLVKIGFNILFVSK